MMFGSIYMSTLYSSTSGGRFILYFFIEILNSIIGKQIYDLQNSRTKVLSSHPCIRLSEITDMSTPKLIDQKQTEINWNLHSKTMVSIYMYVTSIMNDIILNKFRNPWNFNFHVAAFGTTYCATNDKTSPQLQHSNK